MINKLWALFCFVICGGLPSLAQPHTAPDSLFMTPAQNNRWLVALKKQGVADQWAQIRSRYFLSPHQASSPTILAGSVPVLVVDGIVVEVTDAGDPIWDVLARQLTPAKVKAITVLEREPVGLYVNKPFTGVIIVSVADKQLRKVLRRTDKRAQQP